MRCEQKRIIWNIFLAVITQVIFGSFYLMSYLLAIFFVLVLQHSCSVTSVESSISLLLVCKIDLDLILTLFQAQLIPALRCPQNIQMLRAPHNGVLLGYRCTNKECRRLFDSRSHLKRHQGHRSQRGKLCADKDGGEVLFQIPENGSNLQPVRIAVYRLHPGNQLTQCA